MHHSPANLRPCPGKRRPSLNRANLRPNPNRNRANLRPRPLPKEEARRMAVVEANLERKTPKAKPKSKHKM